MIQDKRNETIVDLIGSTVARPAENLGAITALAKLSESVIAHQKLALQAHEDKQDNRLKAWHKLPKIQQNVILFGGLEDGGSIPKEYTEEMFSVLGRKNGAQVEQYLMQTMSGHNMALATEFCTALNKGILTCPDNAYTPKNFTPFLTPTVDDNTDIEENANLLKMAVQDKI